MDFLIQKSCDRTAELDMNYCYKNYYSLTSKQLQLECMTKEPKLICTFKEIFVSFKQGLREVHSSPTRARKVQGPGKVKVRTISFSVIKPKIISVSQLPV